MQTHSKGQDLGFSVSPLNLTSSSATFLQSSLPQHPGLQGPRFLQPAMNFKKAFNRPACLNLHRGQLCKSLQLTPNQLPHGWWVSRMGRPQRTTETGLNMKPPRQLLSRIQFHQLWANCAEPNTTKTKPRLVRASLHYSR